MKSNSIFWNNFYKKKLKINFPSNFAKFIFRFKTFNKKNLLIDVGCGNGRDLLFFVQKKINCYGIDKSFSAIKHIRNNFKVNYDKNFLKLTCGDFTKFNYLKIKQSFSIYSRFTLHTISYSQEKNFFKNLNKCKNFKYLFIEARSTKDSLFGKGTQISSTEFVTDHYRRFIDKNEFIKKIKKNFEIIYIKESKGFSKLGKNNPCLIRLIAKKK